MEGAFNPQDACAIGRPEEVGWAHVPRQACQCNAPPWSSGHERSPAARGLLLCVSAASARGPRDPWGGDRGCRPTASPRACRLACTPPPWGGSRGPASRTGPTPERPPATGGARPCPGLPATAGPGRAGQRRRRRSWWSPHPAPRRQRPTRRPRPGSWSCRGPTLRWAWWGWVGFLSACLWP